MRANRLPEVDNNKFNILKMRKDDLGRLLALANSIDNLRCPGIRRHGDRIYIDPRKQVARQAAPGKATLNLAFAAVVQEPTASSKRLKVRRVEFLVPPNGPIEDGPAAYKFTGELFDAVPFPGFEAIDYKESVIDEATPGNVGDYFLLAMLEEKLGVIGPPPAAPSAISSVTFQSEQPDYITCLRGGDVIWVAKPYLLRRTPFHGQTRGSVRYTYNADGTRRAQAPAIVTGGSPRDLTETQRIVPFYVPGDKIAAMKIDRGSAGVPDVEYLDMNVDGRTWARFQAGVVFTT